jgi:hypothetical protein
MQTRWKKSNNSRQQIEVRCWLQVAVNSVPENSLLYMLNWGLFGPYDWVWMRQKSTILRPYSEATSKFYRLESFKMAGTYLPAYSPTAQQPLGGPGSPYYRGFTITLRQTIFCRIPLNEWHVRRRDLCLTTHNTYKRQTSTAPAGLEHSDPRLRPRGQWDRLYLSICGHIPEDLNLHQHLRETLESR